MNFTTFLRGCQLAGLLALAAMLGGCMTYYAGGSPEANELANTKAYALVQYVFNASDRGSELCKSSENPACQHLEDFDLVSFAIGRNAWDVKKGGLFVPKDAHVEVGDIVLFEFGSKKAFYNRFIRVAARAANTKRLHCGWVGSKIAFSGGVVCDGWRYDKDFPLLAN